MRYIRRFALAGATALVLFMTSGIVLFGIDYYYDGYQPNPGWWNHTQPRPDNMTMCERRPIYYFIREPLNTVSSLLFTFTYVYPFFFGIQDWWGPKSSGQHKLSDIKSDESDIKSNESEGENPYSGDYYHTILSQNCDLSFLTGLIYLCHNIGTSLNHMCSCNIGLILDNIFAWMMFGLPVLITVRLYLFKNKYITVILYLGYCVGVVLLATLNSSIILQNIVSVIMIILILFCNFYTTYKYKNKVGKKHYLWTALGCSIIGLVMAAIDSKACYKNIFGTHTIFHLLGAYGIWCIYMYQWSIRKLDKSV